MPTDENEPEVLKSGAEPPRDQSFGQVGGVELFHREEIMQKQRPCVDLLTDGDKNTKLFQLRASMRPRKNFIKSL